MGEVVCLTVPSPLSLWDLQFFVETEVIGTVICVHCDDLGRPWMLLQLSPNPRQPLIVTVKNFLVETQFSLLLCGLGNTANAHRQPCIFTTTRQCRTFHCAPTSAKRVVGIRLRHSPTISATLSIAGSDGAGSKNLDGTPRRPGQPYLDSASPVEDEPPPQRRFPAHLATTVGEMQPAPPWQMPRNGRTDWCFSFGGFERLVRYSKSFWGHIKLRLGHKRLVGRTQRAFRSIQKVFSGNKKCSINCS